MTDPTAEFIKDAVKRDRLAAIMADPVLKEALEAVKYSLDAVPSSVTEGNPVIAAARFQQIAGMNIQVRELIRMTKDPVDTVKAPKPKRMPDQLPKP